ncbi:phosphodiester glycosidase family protein [Paraflavitalea speifideaquila]|uniref:phosphodiester glycosidase family protein n=1 Tax=Paraflavitalea speifideaquila TaxID=3076558 RepID=UPI0028EEEBA1|nr:phosphodiester glycosidase family protein [Paraflavitalea speifideiaquila]
MHIINDHDTAGVWKAGVLSIEFNGQQYHAMVVNARQHKIRMHWLSRQGAPFKTLDAVKLDLQSSKADVLMITNAGMYLDNNVPLGLFIAAGKELRPIDTASNKTGNFYMQPNGVFYIDKTGQGHILTTHAFVIAGKSNQFKVEYATQSGPMLLSGGIINAAFNPQSKNVNLRSGVGILPNGDMVFIISQSDNTTFYDFASLFKVKFGCRDALYLDGAISKCI